MNAEENVQKADIQDWQSECAFRTGVYEDEHAENRNGICYIGKEKKIERKKRQNCESIPWVMCEILFIFLLVVVICFFPSIYLFYWVKFLSIKKNRKTNK